MKKRSKRKKKCNGIINIIERIGWKNGTFNKIKMWEPQDHLKEILIHRISKSNFLSKEVVETKN